MKLSIFESVPIFLLESFENHVIFSLVVPLKLFSLMVPPLYTYKSYIYQNRSEAEITKFKLQVFTQRTVSHYL